MRSKKIIIEANETDFEDLKKHDRYAIAELFSSIFSENPCLAKKSEYRIIYPICSIDISFYNEEYFYCCASILYSDESEKPMTIAEIDNAIQTIDEEIRRISSYDIKQLGNHPPKRYSSENVYSQVWFALDKVKSIILKSGKQDINDINEVNKNEILSVFSSLPIQAHRFQNEIVYHFIIIQIRFILSEQSFIRAILQNCNSDDKPITIAEINKAQNKIRNIANQRKKSYLKFCSALKKAKEIIVASDETCFDDIKKRDRLAIINLFPSICSVWYGYSEDTHYDCDQVSVAFIGDKIKFDASISYVDKIGEPMTIDEIDKAIKKIDDLLYKFPSFIFIED